MVMKLLNIQPALEAKQIVIREPLGHQTNVLRNRLWYRGDPSELEQFAIQTASDNVSKGRFWAASASEGLRIRKIHSGLPSIVADRLSDIVIGDFDGLELTSGKTDWEAIAEDNGFDELLAESIVDTLVSGDGAFKISIDPVSEFPIIEFYSGEQVDYKRQRGRLQEVLFYTDYRLKDDEYRLEETFGRGYVRTRLLNKYGKEVPLSTVPETAKLAPEVTYTGDWIMAVPMRFFKSPKWPGRGKSIFDSKNDEFDALDEIISQWVDAIRSGRVQKYLPDDLIPKNPSTGEFMRPNPFDNQFIRIGSKLAEDADDKIEVVQPAILYQAFVESYASALDMCLQGIVSPATLGIDLKKRDNAEAQREKEKTTLYTRGKLIEALNGVLPQLVDTTLKVYDTMRGQAAGNYTASPEFGEYASPSFDEVIESVGKAKTFGIMSLETAIDQLYGDSWTDTQKAEEVKRLKEEQSVGMEEPEVRDSDDPPDDLDGDE
ncbi:capsid protein [Paenibacillus sp. MY03]|uniref:capsid protein n=1 Tax=Paenibacillus sp. MY03 TaxID=302980 RepID=UPI000B3C11E8|nr:capsid protein [Paenibacillus sp. MY03]OUS70323.1 capsid protein [Paenibacillus sp. MY03]